MKKIVKAFVAVKHYPTWTPYVCASTANTLRKDVWISLVGRHDTEAQADEFKKQLFKDGWRVVPCQIVVDVPAKTTKPARKGK